jgi:prophage DNA circulation protein
MAATSDIYAAWLDGFELEIETIDDTFSKAIARYEFPYKDGALLEDMGQTAREVRIRCYFWDAEGHQTYEQHAEFLKHLETKELFELVHPQYGPMQGCVESVSVRHDDRIRTAEVDISFVENMRGELQVKSAPYTDVQAGVERSFLDAVSDAISSIQAEIRSILGVDGLGVITAAIDQTIEIIGQITGIGMTARGFVSTLVGGINSLAAQFASIDNLSTSIIGVTSFGDDLCGITALTTAKACERTALNSGTLKESSPVQYIETLATSLEALSDYSGLVSGASSSEQIRAATVVLPKITKMVAAAYLCLELAAIYQADDAAWKAQKRKERVSAWDWQGSYTPQESVSLMTVNDLEQTLQTAREAVQDAIDFARSNDVTPSKGSYSEIDLSSALSGLKSAALKLLQHVNTVKLEREKLVTVELDGAIPLHLVCLKYGLPYNTADRIHAVNQVRNPNRVRGEVAIYAR